MAPIAMDFHGEQRGGEVLEELFPTGERSMLIYALADGPSWLDWTPVK